MGVLRPAVPQRGGYKRCGLSLPEIVARIDALRSIPVRERTLEQALELQRLDSIHYDRMLRLPRRIAKLRSELAELEALAR